MQQDSTSDPRHCRLPAGMMIGSYRVEVPLGEGGMGTVYRATDARLNRPVAIKVLSDELADADSRRRFQREAQMASSLNHPHILTVYDAGDFDGLQYLVTEYIDGGTLEDWIKAEKRTWRQIVELLTGVADGLAAAHAAGMTHRDIKPANILVTKSGYAKLADFGLAKLAEFAESHTTNVPTEWQTKRGIVIGTIPYMSPEQASAQKLDTRSDIFSFGVVVYELLAVHRPFSGRNELELIRAIIEKTPEPLPETVPWALSSVVEKALEKDPAERYQTARDLVVDLRRIGKQKSLGAPAVSQARDGRTRLPWGVAALLGVAVIGLAGLHFRSETPGVEPITFDVGPPQGGAFDSPLNPDVDTVAISPNGTKIAFTAVVDGETRVWIRDLNSVRPRPLAGTENGYSPFWSPDGRSIAFFADGQLKTIVTKGGPAKTLCPTPATARTGTWGSAGDILFADFNEKGGIYRVREEGGAPTRVVASNAGSNGGLLEWPQFLPDGKTFFYLAWHRDKQNEIWIGSLLGDKPKFLMKESSRAAYVAPGYLLFASQGALMAQRFDLAGLQPEGTPKVVVSQIQYFQPTGMALFSASENGVLVYKGWGSASRIALLDRNGREVRAVLPTAAYQGARVSPDGRQVVVSKYDPRIGTEDLYVSDLAGTSTIRRVFSDPGDEFAPFWLDNRTIVFSWDNNAVPYLHRIALDGISKPKPVDDPSGGVQFALDRLPDGSILYQDITETNSDLLLLPPGNRNPRKILSSRYNETMGAVSPDGAWLAYVSDELDGPQVYVRAFASQQVGPPHRISTGGGIWPRWSRDGRELYYLDRGRLMVRSNPRSESGDVTQLFQPAEGIVDYDVAGDGQFLVNLGDVGYNVAPITVIVGWDRNLNP